MNTPDSTHRLAILALPGFVPFDLAIPFSMFSQVTLADGARPYAVFMCGPGDTSSSDSFHITGNEPLSGLEQADTVVIPGIMEPHVYADEAVCMALRRAAANGVRLASICTGAFVLAAAGLLDGLRATTHWKLTDALARRHPAIAVEPDILFVDNGQVLTSAGLASGIDLCLHMIRRDFGAATAERSANLFVLPIERAGSQAQRVRREAPQAGDNLAALQRWLLENLHGDLTLATMANQAAMSPRTLSRKFQEQEGVSPMAWLTNARIRRAQALLETTALPVEQVATAVGFGSAAAFRDCFRRIVGASPTAWRKTYAARPGGRG